MADVRTSMGLKLPKVVLLNISSDEKLLPEEPAGHKRLFSHLMR